MSANAKYKDSVFSFLFSDPDVLRELYCALEGVTLPADVPVTINTLQDVLFMDRVNDISFEIGGKLVVLIEHQSTINPNMALRLLMYVARVYEKIVGDKNIYVTKLIRLPRPEFFVLYNGVAPYPDENILKLSDAFESGTALGLPEKGSTFLELEVKVININGGRNERIARGCKTLAGYSAFVTKAQELGNSGLDKEEAIRKAVVYCREQGILKEFLERHGTEVINMLMTEWKMEDALEVRFSEGWEGGMEKGIEKGIEKGMEKGVENVALNALAMDFSVEVIHQMTGLDIEAIEKLRQSSLPTG
jgi:hypothetical protein